MFHYQESIQNTKGDALIGFFVKLANTSDNSAITLYADSSLTPILSVSGLADACLVDSDGMASFWVPSGTYHLDIYATDGVTLIRRETFVQFGVPDGDYGDVSVAGDAWTVESVNGVAPTTVGAAVFGAASQAAALTAIGAQPLDSDLTAIAALTTTSYGRALLAAADGNDIKPTVSFVVACSDETTALTAGTAKVTFRMPYAFTVTAVYASLTTAQTSGSIFTVDINEAGTSILSTKLTIDNTETDSDTAATAAVISDSSLAARAQMTVDIDQIGDGTAKGLKIAIVGHRT